MKLAALSLAFLSLATTVFGQADAPPLAVDERQEQLKFFRSQVAELGLFRGNDAKEPQPLSPEPVLRYSNSEREIGSLDGATFLWLQGARPIAAVSYSIRRLNSDAYRECTSFSADPLVCRRGEQLVWSPKTGGLLTQKLAGAPAPAAGKVQRLTQMRELARRFTADCYHPRTEAATELRLLTQPLYRFADEQAEVLDGALFAFVVSNDPELFLLLEAVRRKGDSEAHWQYSLARMSSQKLAVRLEHKEIWTVPNYWRDPAEDRKTGPYAEAKAGAFAPASATPAQP
jgi:hypothetical protein